jgi:hypothetical protein
MSSASAAAARPIIYLGMDVHKESITIAVLPAGAKYACDVIAPSLIPKRSGVQRKHDDAQVQLRASS